MSRQTIAVVFGLLTAAGSAGAAGNPRPGAGVTVPAEWSGIWASVDSVYDCSTQALTKVVVRTDTLCAGEDVPPPYIQSTSCSGSADATHIQEHCAESGGLCGEACFVTDTFDLDATRTGDSAHWVWITQAVSSCHAPICDSCVLTHRHATRVAPGPCGVVPTRGDSWGKLKASYR